MIKQIQVDGFKSLNKFLLTLHPGLNILVGPNGSGKTNIISFFEFLGDLQSLDVSNAICNSGGAGSVFAKIGRDKYKPRIRVDIYGDIGINKKRYLIYNFMFVIEMRESAEFISYDEQRLKLKYRTVTTIDFSRIKQWDFDIKLKTSDDGKTHCHVEELDRRRFKLRHPFLKVPEERLDKSNELQLISSFISSVITSEESLINGLQYLFNETRDIFADLRGGKVYNIVPSKSKIPEDSARNPGINKDGSGLYATLYAMKKTEKSPREARVFFRRKHMYGDMKKADIKDVIKYVNLANDAISDIEVFNDPFDNQLKVHVTIESENENSILPLSSMSDGTIKWISLITIILTSRFIFSVEEPENYLHPLMQAEIMSIMRSSIRGNRFILLSTHSETILNNSMPEEIIVVSFKNGKTTAVRPSNAEELNREIKSTGFGLGYYYIAGSLESE
jgi:predicted ATPase